MLLVAAKPVVALAPEAGQSWVAAATPVFAVAVAEQPLTNHALETK